MTKKHNFTEIKITEKNLFSSYYIYLHVKKRQKQKSRLRSNRKTQEEKNK